MFKSSVMEKSFTGCVFFSPSHSFFLLYFICDSLVNFLFLLPFCFLNFTFKTSSSGGGGREGCRCRGPIDWNPHLQTASVHTLHFFVQFVFSGSGIISRCHCRCHLLWIFSRLISDSIVAFRLL